MATKTMLCDLDNTLYAGHWYKGGPAVGPNLSVVRLLRRRLREKNTAVTMISGRGENMRFDTEMWLRRHVLQEGMRMPAIKLCGDHPEGWHVGKVVAAFETVRNEGAALVESFDDDASILLRYREVLSPLCKELRLYQVTGGVVAKWNAKEAA